MAGAKRVLIVEDNHATCALMQAFLELTDTLEVCGEAHDGYEGLELLHTQWPDLILLDLIMPGMDGLQFLQALLDEKPAKRPKILVLSGVGSDEFVQQAISLGADYYLMKPVRYEELAVRINALFPEEKAPPSKAVWLLLQMGAEEECQGFSFACRGAELLQRWGKETQLKEIYLCLAKEFDTTYSRVEKNIRTTIRQIHAAGAPLYRERMKSSAGEEKQPDNGTFLRALAKELGQE